MDYINHVFAQTVYTYVERIDIHLHHVHQLLKGSTEIQKKLKTQKNSPDSLRSIFPTLTRTLTMIKASNLKNLMKMKRRKKEALPNTQIRKPVKKDKTPSKISQRQPEKESPKSKSQKMPCSTAKDTCLRCV